MQKLLLMSILIMTVAIPMNVSRQKNPSRGMKRMTLYWVLFVIVWAYLIKKFFWTLAPPPPPPE